MSKLKDSMRVKSSEYNLREKEVQEKGIERAFEAIIFPIVLGGSADLSYVMEQFEKRGVTLSVDDIKWTKEELLTLELQNPKSILDTIEIIEDVELDNSLCESLFKAGTQEAIGEPLSAFAYQDFNEVEDDFDDIDSELRNNTEQILKQFLESIENCEIN